MLLPFLRRLTNAAQSPAGKPVEPARFAIPHGSGCIDVSLRRSPTARRLTLRVSSATGEVVLTVPPRVKLAAARDFAERQTGWIAARLAALPQRIPFTVGAVLPLRGEPFVVVCEGPTRAATRIDRDRPGGPAIIVGGSPAGVAGRVKRFLQAEAMRDYQQAVARHAGTLGLAPGRITLRDPKGRWGSCSSAGGLSFSWRLILAPPVALDYLAAHEVAHLREMNHSNRFWRLVHELAPETDAAEAWLKRHGAGLHRYG
jgi:predicted metal-dependent hydrolase